MKAKTLLNSIHGKRFFFYNAWVKVKEYEAWKVTVSLTSGV